MPLRKVLVFLVLVCFAPLSYSWSTKGHAEIAKAAYAGLTPAQQNAYVRLLKGNKISLPKYSPATQIGYLARWPDQVRNITLQEIFNKYGSGKVPRALAAYSRENTNNWHYQNTLFINEEGRVVAPSKTAGKGVCPPASNGRLFKVWPDLLKAYQQAADVRDKTVILSLILHFAGDAYQPLHVMAALKPGCKHDGGGNGFCVSPGTGRFTGKKEQCKLNLHQSWDRGFGLFDKGFKPLKAQHKGRASDLESVLNLHRDWATQIYPSAKRRFDSDAYQSRAREIAHDASSRALAHQIQLLKELVPR